MATQSVQLTPEAREALAPSCFKCQHFRTCVLFRHVNQAVAMDFPPDEQGKPTTPLKPKDIASICDAYNPEGDIPR